MGTARKIQYILNKKGERTSVVLPLSEYEKLIEDLGDLRSIEERRRAKPISIKEVKTRWVKKRLNG